MNNKNTIEDTARTKFYEYAQNNSGGLFFSSEKDGIYAYVIIEALNANDANDRALDIGLYFDGCKNGQDCHCCGDRWYMADESSGSDIPSIYGSPVENMAKDFFRNNCAIHYLDGTVKVIKLK